MAFGRILVIHLTVSFLLATVLADSNSSSNADSNSGCKKANGETEDDCDLQLESETGENGREAGNRTETEIDRRSSESTAADEDYLYRTLFERISAMSDEQLQDLVNLLIDMEENDNQSSSDGADSSGGRGRKSRTNRLHRRLPTHRIGGWPSSTSGGKKPIYQKLP